jgi:chromosome segregation ATPase
MSKRLAPGLFDDVTAAPETQNPYYGLASQSQNPSLPPVMGPAITKMELQKLTDEVNAVKAKTRSYENQLDVFKNQISDVLKSIDQRFERLSQALSRLEKSLHNSDRNTEQKIQSFREKLQNANLEEAKVEGLIERQTIVIRNFENRLSAMQQLINEKELLIMRYTEALKQYQNPKK